MLKSFVFLIGGILIILRTVLSVSDGCPAHLFRGTYLRTNRDRCYLFVLLKHLDWSGAEKDCVLRGGHLASVRNMEEELFLISSLRSLNLIGRGVWIGLNDRDKEGRYVWTSGDSVDFTYWAPGQANQPLERRSIQGIDTRRHPFKMKDTQQGDLARRFLFSSKGSESHLLPGLIDGSDEDCVILKYTDSGHWHDYPCKKLDLLGLVPERFPYICQFPRDVMTTPSTTTTTTSVFSTKTLETTKRLQNSTPTTTDPTIKNSPPSTTSETLSTVTTPMSTPSSTMKLPISTHPVSTATSTKSTETTATVILTNSQTRTTSTRATQATVTTPMSTPLSTTKLPISTYTASASTSSKSTQATVTVTETDKKDDNKSSAVTTTQFGDTTETTVKTETPVITTGERIGVIIG